jgi:hypothetical protein
MGADMDGFGTAVMVILLGFPLGALLPVAAAVFASCRSHGLFWITTGLSSLVNGCFFVFIGGGGIGKGIPWFVNVPAVSLLLTVGALGFYLWYAAPDEAHSNDIGNDSSVSE